ncbi:MAG: amino acid permease [Planctomycetes bacterium]|nr:amino acid permease [Planctomycetota bacterium]
MDPRSLFLRKVVSDPAETGAHGAGQGPGLKRTLGALDLTMLGIGAIIGAGLFGSIKDMITGTSALQGAGPAVMISFLLTAIACGFAALCYAEIAAMMPVSGSAYSYSYAAFGELIAWIIGWDLMVEYAIGNVYVAQSWTDHFQTFLEGISGSKLPLWLVRDFQSATTLLADANATIAAAVGSVEPSQALIDAQAVVAALGGQPTFSLPGLGSFIFSCNLPATAITLALTVLLFVGVSESARANAAMVVLKVALILAFLGIGIFHIDPLNWSDPAHGRQFAPNGFNGIWQAAAIGFFAYIGFDAVSTAAEETKNPQRDLPRGLIWSLAICTLLYIATAAVLTGVVPYETITTHDPLAQAFEVMGYTGGKTAFAFGAVIAMTAVLLVFQLGQTRIFMVMARDGLLPKTFAKIHPRYRTPHVNTWVMGLVVALCCNLLTPGQAIGLCNIGTLFAFILVSIGVIVLRRREPDRPRPFRVPGYPFTPIVSALACLALVCGLEVTNWLRLVFWLQLGLVVYAGFGYRNSALRRNSGVPLTAGRESQWLGWLLIAGSVGLSYRLLQDGAPVLESRAVHILATLFLGGRILFVELIGLGFVIGGPWVSRAIAIGAPVTIVLGIALELHLGTFVWSHALAQLAVAAVALLAARTLPSRSRRS